MFFTPRVLRAQLINDNETAFVLQVGEKSFIMCVGYFDSFETEIDTDFVRDPYTGRSYQFCKSFSAKMGFRITWHEPIDPNNIPDTWYEQCKQKIIENRPAITYEG